MVDSESYDASAIGNHLAGSQDELMNKIYTEHLEQQKEIEQKQVIEKRLQCKSSLTVSVHL